MINIPVFTNDELVNFARVYTKENGYAIDQMGMLALYNLIGINQKEDSLTVQSVTDHFTEVNQSQFLVVEIQHLMMLFTWQMWQRKYM